MGAEKKSQGDEIFIQKSVAIFTLRATLAK